MAGTYELRYVLRDELVIARAPIAVTESSASIPPNDAICPGEATLWGARSLQVLFVHAHGFLLNKRFFILDRDPLFTREFRPLLRNFGVACVRLRARSPNLNAFTERFVRSVLDECFSRLVPLGEAQPGAPDTSRHDAARKADTGSPT